MIHLLAILLAQAPCYQGQPCYSTAKIDVALQAGSVLVVGNDAGFTSSAASSNRQTNVEIQGNIPQSGSLALTVSGAAGASPNGTAGRAIWAQGGNGTGTGNGNAGIVGIGGNGGASNGNGSFGAIINGGNGGGTTGNGGVGLAINGGFGAASGVGGVGTVITGRGTAEGADISNGTAATNGTYQDALVVENGDILFGGVNPAQTLSFTNQSTGANQVKVWAILQTTGDGTTGCTIQNGFNVTSCSVLTSGTSPPAGTITLTYASNFNNFWTSQWLQCSQSGVKESYVFTSNVGSLEFEVYNVAVSTTTPIACQSNVCTCSVGVMGTQ